MTAKNHDDNSTKHFDYQVHIQISVGTNPNRFFEFFGAHPENNFGEDFL